MFREFLGLRDSGFITGDYMFFFVQWKISQYGVFVCEYGDHILRGDNI